MARWTPSLVLLPLCWASEPCFKESILAKDALLPVPSSYVQSWKECQKNCQAAGVLCDRFSFKEDSMPSGACWLFPKSATVTETSDPKAITGPKECPAVVVPPEAPDAKPMAQGPGKAGLRGYGIPAAAAHSYGVANAGHPVPGAVFEDGEAGKTLAATPSSGDASNLAVAGAAGAAAVALGAFIMLGTGKKKTKRGLQREELGEELAETARSSAPLMEPPQVIYPGAPMVTYMPEMLQPMAAYQAQAPEYRMVTEPVTAGAQYAYANEQPQYAYEQPQVMAYQPTA